MRKIYLPKTIYLQIVLLLGAAVAIVIASLSVPQKLYFSGNTAPVIRVECGLPFTFLSVQRRTAEPVSFPYVDSCYRWSPLEESGDFRTLLFTVNVLLVFITLAAVAMVVPRVIVAILPFIRKYSTEHIYTLVVAVVATAVIVGSYFTVKINNIQIAADENDFSYEEAIILAQTENPALSEYDGGYREDGVVKSVVVSPAERKQWKLQFVEEKSDRVVQAYCYTVTYASARQVVLIDSFQAGGGEEVAELDMNCIPSNVGD